MPAPFGVAGLLIYLSVKRGDGAEAAYTCSDKNRSLTVTDYEGNTTHFSYKCGNKGLNQKMLNYGGLSTKYSFFTLFI